MIVAILFVAVLIFIGRWDSIFAATRPVHVRFDHSTGIQSLRVKDPVCIGGVNVGRVKKIWLETGEVTRDGRTYPNLFVHVLGEIPDDILLYEDVKIGIGTKFVGEGGTLDILETGCTGRGLQPDDVVEGMPPEGFTELTARISRELDGANPDSLLAQVKGQLDLGNAQSLLAKIHRSVDDLNAVSTEIRTQLSPDQQASLIRKLDVTMDHINATTAALRGEINRAETGSALARVHQVLNSLNAAMASAQTMMEASQPKVISAVTHVDETARRINEDITVKLSKELDKTDTESLLAKLHASLTSARAGMDNLKVMTETGREVLTLNRDNLQAVIDNFAETSAHLKATAKEVRRNPWRLLYKPDQPEREYANLLASARAFSDAAASLDQANAKLKKMTEQNTQNLDPDDPQLRVIREQIQKAFCDFEQAQEKLWDLLKVKTK